MNRRKLLLSSLGLSLSPFTAAFARAQDTTNPVNKSNPVVIVKGSHKTRKGGATMAFVPGGTFTMGDTKQSVTVAGFWMDMTPVTVGQYKAYCTATGKSMPKAPDWGWVDGHPMVSVDWNQATAYAKWADGRLPTSAEFEYAARDGGTNFRFPWGDTFDTSKLWCSIKSLGDAGKTAPVDRHDHICTNSLGLSDMAGNVMQWCNDGPDSSSKYIKGGSWNINVAGNFQCAYRGNFIPSMVNDITGFRVLHPGL